jgi:hypothetical protein
MFVCCVCCVLSGRSLCDELITCLEESYRLWCVVVCDQKTSWYEEAVACARQQSRIKKKQAEWIFMYSLLWFVYSSHLPNNNLVTSARAFYLKLIVL